MSEAMDQRVWGKRETIDDLFASIQLGQPVYLWFREEREGREEYVVRRVVGDGGGTLWTDDRGYGMRVTPEMRARCGGRVWTPDEVRALEARVVCAPVSDVDVIKMEILIADEHESPAASPVAGPEAEQEDLLRNNALVQRVVGDFCACLEVMLDEAGVFPYLPGMASTMDRVQAALEDYAVLRAERGQLTAGAPPAEALRADAQETAAFAVFDALCLLTGEAGLHVPPSTLAEWARRVLESLLRADVGWAIGALVEADAALRMRVRKP